MFVLLTTAAIVGFNQSNYTIEEDGGAVEICIVVYQPDGEVPVEFEFEVEVTTGDGTAGSNFFISHCTEIFFAFVHTTNCSLLHIYYVHVVEPGDYTAVDAVLLFRVGQLQNCIDVPISSDMELEENEVFYATLVPGDDFNPAIMLDPVTTTVHIIERE